VQLSPATFDELRGVIHRLCGLVVTKDKAYLIRHRLEPIVRVRGLRGFDELALALRSGAPAALTDALVEAITTKETSFFRDDHPFETFRQHVLPWLGEMIRARKKNSGRQPFARLWCAGASTGQEPYSLAMLTHDYATANRERGIAVGDFEILATDVSAQALATAAAATYAERELARGMTTKQIHRYFEKTEQGWSVREKVRKLVVFRRVNLIQPLSGLGVFDLICCRNVLIYFDEETRRRICRQFADMLSANGFLLLGSSENLYGVTDRFESLNFGSTLVYRKSSV
jgi:chemotaxis protein methyltransferase CheR